MAGGIGVDLVALGRFDVLGRLQQASAERRGFVMGGLDVIDVQVEVDLLRRSTGPLGGNMVRRQLDGQPRLAVDVDGVPIVVRVDGAAEQARQKVLSAVRSAASKTTICRVILMPSSLHRRPFRRQVAERPSQASARIHGSSSSPGSAAVKAAPGRVRASPAGTWVAITAVASTSSSSGR